MLHVSQKRHCKRNAVMALLSFKAGLRACEISGIDWSMVCGPNGSVKDTIELGMHIAKYGARRQIPCNSALQKALRQLHVERGRPVAGPICYSERGDRIKAKAVVNWFAQQYAELGFDGCSSHSGRRTMITMAARSLAQVGGSLRDVQELAGHRSLATTEGYIQGDRAIQRRLVDLL